jgi:glutamine synthetase/predicted TIM-barrel fold metal-dependent hydrolase
MFRLIESIELFDQHAHLPWQSAPSHRALLMSMTEANHDDMQSIDNVCHTLAYKRMVHDLNEISLPLNARSLLSAAQLCSLMIAKSQMRWLLIDGGFSVPSEPSLSIDELAQNSRCDVRRIVRVESVACDLLLSEFIGNSDIKWSAASGSASTSSGLFQRFLARVSGELSALARLDAVVAFKSVACYRGGLSIDPDALLSVADNERRFDALVRDADTSAHWKLGVSDDSRWLLECVVCVAMRVAGDTQLPVQFHTGFGDRDVSLPSADASVAKRFLEANEARWRVNVVLLHAAWPYVRQCAYLASVYAHVHVSFCLAIPLLSVAGMRSTLAALLELAPCNKIVYSSDAHAVPDHFYAASKWSRRLLAELLDESIRCAELSVDEATHIAHSILYANSCRLYRLASAEREHRSSAAGAGAKAEWLKIVFADYANNRRAKIVNWRRASDRLFVDGIGATKGNHGCSAINDSIVLGTGLSAVGEMRLVPDASTLCSVPECEQRAGGMMLAIADCRVSPASERLCGGGGSRASSSSCLSSLQRPEQLPDWQHCGRTALRRQLARLKASASLELMCGFENEFYLLSADLAPLDRAVYASTHASATSRRFMSSLCAALDKQGVGVLMTHAEGGPSQRECVLEPLGAMRAVDTLVVFRETLRALGAEHELVPCLLPAVFADTSGSGTHVHMSLWRDGANVTSGGGDPLSPGTRAFMAGLLEHMPALLALTAPTCNSYRRMKERAWVGVFCAWGFDNRECPLRVPTSDNCSHFEYKLLDATANPHWALAAIVAAGLDGIERSLALPSPSQVDPSDDESATRLPSSLGAALDALSSDSVLCEALGTEAMRVHITIKRHEIEQLESLSLAQQLSLLHSTY